MTQGREFALFEVSKGMDCSIDPTENICDIIAKWDQYIQVMSTKGFSLEFTFQIKQKIYMKLEEEPTDSTESTLLFYQVLHY